MLFSIIKKFSRLILYAIKGNYDYAFGQFTYTTYLRRKTLHKQYANTTKKHDNAVVFDLQNAKDRYVFNVINTYKLANYDVHLKPNYKFYTASKGLYFQEIFTFLNVGFFTTEKQLESYKNVHYVYDYDEHKSLQLKDFTAIEITNKGAIKAQSLKFPFGFHPNTYKHFNIKSKERLDEVLFTNKDNDQNAYTLVFAGSTNNEDYNNIKNYFPELIDRNIVFEEIRKQFNAHISIDYRIKEDKPILISDSLNNIRISEIELYKIFKNSNFFIAPPGFEMPFCHNLYEAMSCGLIPILQYSDYLFPNLENGVNCLTFANENELIDGINRSLTMTASEIEAMKNNVLDYYKKHMLPSAFITRLESHKEIKTPVFYVSGITN